MAMFLQAAVNARMSILVGGIMGTAKTTLVRAMAAAIDPNEHIATLETERELHLDKIPGRHGRVLAWEASPGSGEYTSAGTRAGQRTLDEMLFDSFRFSLTRMIVGEVRGTEVIALFKAAQAGAATISTIHATNAAVVIDRLATLAMEAGAHVTSEYAMRQIAYNFDLIIYMRMRTLPNGRKHRYVSDILALGRDMENGRPSLTDVYQHNPNGPATPVLIPDTMRIELEAAGLPAGHFRNGGIRL